MTYNQIMDHIEQSEEDAIVWRLKRIAGHEGPLTKNHPMWKGSIYNVCVEWENGEITNEPMTTIAANDPVTCAIYAKDNNLLYPVGSASNPLPDASNTCFAWPIKPSSGPSG
jgi:hypothetical protein